MVNGKMKRFLLLFVPIFLLSIFMPDFAFSSKTARNVLNGKIICIDPGHQRFGNKEQEPISPNNQSTKPKVASGAVGIVSGTPEYIITLKIAEKLKKLLLKEKVVVFMTRETHDINISNVERALLGNKTGAKIMIRIHADSSSDSSKRGVSMLIPSEKNINNPLLVTESKKAGEAILKEVSERTKAHNLGTVERDDLSGFNWSEVPVVLIETGFLSNSEDDKLLNSKNYQDKLAEGIFNGLVEYFSTNL
jgi:N-acetylmuramoyl-L-alanine amidase